MVFYRKYRPQKIEDLDSKSLQESLFAILSKKEIPHALLFAGPKGLGKTSTARIVAKVVNCTNRGKNIEPCNKCEQCISITNGSNIDVLEIDGASNRGIEEIRDLKEKIRVFPSSASKKIYIIDEVHMLTTEAFNALLKIVEEPPEYVMFIFATTELEKVPETILSRCFIVNFKKATQSEVIHSLKRIVEGEKINITDGALEEIAKYSEGGFRDGAKYLEEVSTFASDKKIDIEDVRKILGTSGIEQSSIEFLEALIKKDLKKSLEILKNLEEKGSDAKYFASNLLQILQDSLMAKNGFEMKNKIDENLEDIYLMLEIFSDAALKIKNAIYPFLPIEMGAVHYFLIKNNDELGSRNQEVGNIKNNNSNSRKTIEDLEKMAMTKKIVEFRIHPPAGGSELKDKKINTEGKIQQGNLHDQKDLLDNLIYKVKADNFSLAGVLRSFKSYEIQADQIVLKTKYKFHKQKLEEAKNLSAIAKALKEITGKNLKVLVSLE